MNEQIGSDKAMREKVWPERSVDEKLEALRHNLAFVMNQISELSDDIHALSRHQHSPNGDILRPLNDVERDFPFGRKRHSVPFALRDSP